MGLGLCCGHFGVALRCVTVRTEGAELMEGYDTGVISGTLIAGRYEISAQTQECW